MSKKTLKKVVAITLTGSMVAGMAITSNAATSTTYDPPTSPMELNKDQYITATAHRAASPVLGMMGLNASSGFGMINGAAPTSLEAAEKSPALAIWGTTLNQNPDPYYWNYFYNFYAEANGLEKSSDALLNPSVQASPMAADTTLMEEYGNISVSLSTRPDIVVGTTSKNSDESDTHGYDSQLETIHSFTKDSDYYHEGDETYSPKLVPYTRSTLVQMISSVYNIADAMDEVTAETGKTGRYGDGQVIAENYEKYVYGTIAYIRSEIANGDCEEKTIAVVTGDDGAGTYTIANASTQEATSSNRWVEYTDYTCENLSETKGTSVSAADLAGVDAIILNVSGTQGQSNPNTNTIDADTLRAALQKESTYNSDLMIISNYPNTLYGITMNSVENAMGLGYTNGYIYSDVLDIDPVEMCAFFYEDFYHLNGLDALQKVVSTNFASVTLPSGVSSTLTDDYSNSKVESMLAQGMNYYEQNIDAFADTYIKDWTINWEEGIGAGMQDEEPYVTYIAADGTETKLHSSLIESCNLTDNNNYLLSDVLAAAGVTTTADCTYKMTSGSDGYTVYYDADYYNEIALYYNGGWRCTYDANAPEYFGNWGKVGDLETITEQNHEFGDDHICTNVITTGRVKGDGGEKVSVTTPCGAIGTGIVTDEDGVQAYYVDGELQSDVTDVKKVDGKWYNLVDGIVTAGPTVEKNSNGWWYINADGVVDFTYTGFAQNKNGWWYVENGKVTFAKKDVIKDTAKTIDGTASWYFVSGSKVQLGVNSVEKNSKGWWYIKNGKVDFTYTGVAKNANGWWRIENGKVNFSFNGLAKNANGWWYLQNGKVNFNYNGLAKNAAGTWLVQKGKVNFNFTGTAYGKKIVNGKVK